MWRLQDHDEQRQADERRSALASLPGSEPCPAPALSLSVAGSASRFSLIGVLPLAGARKVAYSVTPHRQKAEAIQIEVCAHQALAMARQSASDRNCQ
jgi:hypothetical protein